ncbi:MAG: hypothetical protein RJA70_2240 [Pseudomonadota bacterium]|jgi:MFS family permease
MIKLKDLPTAVGIGIVATGVMDTLNEWAAELDLVGKYDPRLLGRVAAQWTQGNFAHDSVAMIPKVAWEYAYGVFTHYTIGSVLALVFLLLRRRAPRLFASWPIPVLFGLATSVFAWFYLFPSVGFGLFGLKAPPAARLFSSSLFNHAFYGIGLLLASRALDAAERFVEDSPFTSPNDENARVPGALFLTLGAAQAVAASCLAITFMMGSLVLVDLSAGNKLWAGVPTAMILVSAAVAAYPLGAIKDRAGYRRILDIGFLVGLVGGLLAGFGALLASRALIMVGCVGVGCANGSILLSRFVAAELTCPQQRGKGVSLVMTGATVGAIGGPLIAHVTNNMGMGLGLGKGVAPLLAVALLCLVGFIAMRVGLRGEPQEHRASPAQGSSAASGAMGASPSIDRGRAIFAGGSLLFGQLAMVFLMAVTPVHMHACHHSVGAISVVLMVHFMGMYGMSFLSGALSDRLGRVAVISMGSCILMLACVVGLASTSFPALLLALFLLGMGWNFCFISGSVLVADVIASSGARRGRIQGLTDAALSLSSAVASLSSGVVLARIGFSALALVGLAMAAVPLLLVLTQKSRVPVPAE